ANTRPLARRRASASTHPRAPAVAPRRSSLDGRPSTVAPRRSTAAVPLLSRRTDSDVEPEMDHVAVPDDVVLPLDGELPRLPTLGLAPQGDEILPPDDLRLDEAPLEIRVDHPGGLGRRSAAG